MCNVLSNNEFQYNRIRWWTLVFKKQVLKVNYVTIVYSHFIESSFKAFLCNDHEMLTYKVLLQSVGLWFIPIKQLVARPSVSSKHISSFFIDFPALFHVLVFLVEIRRQNIRHFCSTHLMCSKLVSTESYIDMNRN